ncbi:pyruvate dehydrogenase E1 component beta subunit [Solimonas aquatica]|uniref:2-oxoisovalerate dehydrogenase subunit beta n=1 Tax=Solimonas aquatica TaxID=489703 RepID=A0A1H9CH23_9GAMM|nr:alpha-ketoacid dehydrogenase subunit beta [Solimonas aquatica]SEQ00469.1 pyruvate dehydrogenase E1 component beta subunit [Solimonas aquatica]
MPELNLIEAVNLALRSEMQRDAGVLVLGEDVGRNGGVFRATVGLLDAFGEERVIDTPLAETLIAAMAIGLATQGFKPVAEIQFSGFTYPCIDQIVNHAARYRHRTRSRLSCPMVLRAPNGGGIHAPEHHSESVEATFAHIPGLRVVAPSTPARAYGLLLAAIRDPDPVIFLEPTRLYRLFKQAVEDNGEALPLDTAFVEREGQDLTLVSWGAMMQDARAAADRLAEEGISVELIDVATIKPLDMDTILASVAKTGRCVIVQESPRAGGWASEIAANIAEHGLLNLFAPVLRVSGYDTIMPLARHEALYIPDTERILAEVRKVFEFAPKA